MVLLAQALPAQRPGDRPAPNPRATRSVVMARRAMIATSQPLASAAGLQVLREGGNAIDAAVTAAAVLSVVEPTMNGIGGDLFAIVTTRRRSGSRDSTRAGAPGSAATPGGIRAARREARAGVRPAHRRPCPASSTAGRAS